MNIKKIIVLVFSAILFIIFPGCSSEDKIVNPLPASPPEIVWVSKGLDTCMVFAILADDSCILAGTNYGLFKSTDNGDSWMHINQDSLNGSITNLCKLPDNSIAASISGKGIFKSSDNGGSWEYFGLRNLAITAVAADSRGKIFAGTRNGIYASAIPYDEWWPVNPDFNNQTFSALLIASLNTVFAGGTGVYRSDDNGITWNLKNNGLGNWSVYSLISGSNSEIYAGTDVGGFFRSTNNGESWTQSNTGMVNTEITSLTVNKNGHVFSGTWHGGVYRSIDDGNTWTVIDSGLTINSIYTIIITQDDYLFAGSFKGIFRTENKVTASSSKEINKFRFFL